VYIIARCSSLNTTTFCLIHVCPVLPRPTHSIVQRLGVKFPEKPPYLTPRMPCPGDFCGHILVVLTEFVGDFRLPYLAEVDEYF
jgi:hypothetical protein